MNNYGTNQQMKKKKKPEISFGFSINDDMTQITGHENFIGHFL